MIHLSWPRALRPVARAMRWHRRPPTVVTVLDIRPNQRARRYEIVLGPRRG